MTTKEYLNKLRTLDKQIDSKLEQIDRLRSLAEREKGCEYCKNRFGIATHHVTESGMQAGTNKAAAFCPMCGRRLEVNDG